MVQHKYCLMGWRCCPRKALLIGIQSRAETMAGDSTDAQMAREDSLQHHPSAAQDNVTTRHLSPNYPTAANCNTTLAECNTHPTAAQCKAVYVIEVN